MKKARFLFLILALILVAGMTTGLIVHKTAEGSQSVVKRPKSEGTETVLESSSLIPVFVTARTGGYYSVSVCDKNGEPLDPIPHNFHDLDPSDDGLLWFPVIGYSDLYLVPAGSIIHFSGNSDAKAGKCWWVDALFSDGTVYENPRSYTPVDYIIPEDCVFVTVQYSVATI